MVNESKNITSAKPFRIQKRMYVASKSAVKSTRPG